MSVSLIGCWDIALLVLFITEGSIQFRRHKFLKDVFEAVLQQAVDISHAVQVVICNDMSYYYRKEVFFQRHKLLYTTLEARFPN